MALHGELVEVKEEILGALREREEFFDRWRRDTADTRALASGEWNKVFTEVDEMNPLGVPMIANLPRVAIEDGGRLFAEILPSERVDPSSDRDKTRAEERERALQGYNNASEIYDSQELFGQDLIASGIAAIKVWPAMGVPASKRFPIFSRLDPSEVLPEPRWAPHKPTDNVIVQRIRTVEEMRHEFPEPVQAIIDAITDVQTERARREFRAIDLSAIQGFPADGEIIDYYSSRHITRVLLVREGADTYAEVLVSMENPTGICPVQLAARYTWALQPMGQIADSKGVLQTQNRYFYLLLRQFTQMVFGPVVSWNVRNPGATSGVIHALGPDFKYQRFGAESVSFQAFQIMEMLEDAARTSMVAPRSREGEVDLNKATAAFLSRAQGQLTSVVKSLQRSWATAKRRANEAAFAQDKTWANARKTITGRARGRRFRMTYTPSDLIGDDLSNRVVYGTSSGLDKPTDQTLKIIRLDRGLLSEESFLEDDPDIEDPAQEMARLRAQKLRKSLEMLLENPQTPIEVRIRIHQAFKETQTPEQAIERFAELEQEAATAQPALPAGGGPPGLPAPPAQRPGIPGAEAGELLPFGELQRRATRRR